MIKRKLFGFYLSKKKRRTNVATDSGSRLVNTRRLPSPLNFGFGHYKDVRGVESKVKMQKEKFYKARKKEDKNGKCREGERNGNRNGSIY